ncbi:hypothetical protein MUB16_01695 [Priestia sp. OVL9]|nr:hypothetical protein [Priestia sp. OVL9]
MKAEIQDLWDNLVFHYEHQEEFQLIILDNKKVKHMWDNYNASLLKILHKKIYIMQHPMEDSLNVLGQGLQ